jgi:hypothetical protein
MMQDVVVHTTDMVHLRYRYGTKYGVHGQSQDESCIYELQGYLCVIKVRYPYTVTSSVIQCSGAVNHAEH